jgi:hypothetical protein
MVKTIWLINLVEGQKRDVSYPQVPNITHFVDESCINSSKFSDVFIQKQKTVGCRDFYLMTITLCVIILFAFEATKV